MIDSIIFYIVAFLLGSLGVGLYVSVVNIVIAAMRPQRKYQKTSTFDPAFPAWVGTIFVMLCVSTIIALQTLPGVALPYKRYIVMFLTSLVFLTIGLISGAARRDIHPDDPEKKLTPGMTIVNTTAACIPLIVSILGASGIANAIGTPGTILTTAILFFVLAIPSSIGASLTMLFARSASSTSYTYGTLSVIGLMLLSGIYLLPSN